MRQKSSGGVVETELVETRPPALHDWTPVTPPYRFHLFLAQINMTKEPIRCPHL